MNADDELVLTLLPNAIFSRAGWFRVNCPFCVTVLAKQDKKRSFGIHVDGAYHCFRCYTRGKLAEMPDWAGMGFGAQVNSIQEDRDTDFLKEVGEFIPLWREPGVSAIILEEAREYLTRKRKLNKTTWEQASIGACMRGTYAQRIIVPIFNEEGDDWAGFVSRTWQKNGAYRYPLGMSREMFYEQQLLREQTDEPLIVVEGVLDALPYFGQAVACLGKPTGWHRKELLTVKNRPIAVCLDGDAWEEAEGLSLFLRFQGVERVGYVRLPPGEDPNSVDRDWLLEEARRCVT